MSRYNIELIDVLGDGDCYYRAIYGFAMTNNILDILFNCFNCNINDPNTRSFIDNKILRNGFKEDNWIKCIRALLSSKILNDIKYRKVVLDFYNSITSSFLSDDELENNYQIYKEHKLPSWFTTEYPSVKELKRHGEQKFVEFIANKIKKKGTWAFNSIDTQLMNLHMKKCGLRISEYTSLNESKKIPISPPIYIRNSRPSPQPYSDSPVKVRPSYPHYEENKKRVITSIPGQFKDISGISSLLPAKKQNITKPLFPPLQKGGALFVIYLYNQGSVHYNFISWVPINEKYKGGNRIIKNRKIFIKGKIYRKYFDKINKKYYIKKNNKKIYIKSKYIKKNKKGGNPYNFKDNIDYRVVLYNKDKNKYIKETNIINNNKKEIQLVDNKFDASIFILNGHKSRDGFRCNIYLNVNDPGDLNYYEAKKHIYFNKTYKSNNNNYIYVLQKDKNMHILDENNIIKQYTDYIDNIEVRPLFEENPVLYKKRSEISSRRTII